MAKYRVTRETEGINWSSWTHSYHATLTSAVFAAQKFWNGEGNFKLLNLNDKDEFQTKGTKVYRRNSTVTISSLAGVTVLSRGRKLNNWETLVRYTCEDGDENLKVEKIQKIGSLR